MAKILDMSVSGLQKLVRQGVIQKTERGKYNLLPTVTEYIKYIHRRDMKKAEDPDDLQPKDRLDWYRGTREKTRHQTETGELVLAETMESTLADAMKIVAVTMESLPDVLERDCGIDGKTVAKAQEVMDRLRVDLHERLVASGDA